MDKDCFNILSYAASTYRTEDKDKGLSLLSDIVNVLAEKQRRFAKDPFWLNGDRKLDAVMRMLRNVLSAEDRHCFRADFAILSGINGSNSPFIISAELLTLKSVQFITFT